MKLWEILLDIVFPLQEREKRVQTFTPKRFTIMPMHHTGDVPIVSLLDYRDANVRDTVRALKFKKLPKAAKLLAVALADFLEEEIAEHSILDDIPIYITCVPLGKERKRERGFNQVAFVLDMLDSSSTGKARTRADLLQRTRETKPQMKLGRAERLKNVAGAFSLRENAPENLRGTHIFLIDDITTTGATLTHAARPLIKAGASVTAIALAHA